MNEVGVIINTDKKRATVKVDKKDECSKCGMCLFPKNANSIEFSATNEIGAQTGDTVMLEMKESTKLLGAILAFLVPLLLIGVAVAVVYLFFDSEIWILVFSLIFIVLWYTILAVIDKMLKNSLNFSPTVVSIIRKGEQNESGD